MTHWHDALRSYRRMPLDGAQGPSARRIMFALCSANHAAAAVAAACEPAVVLQVLGGAGDPSDPAVRATFEYAILHEEVRHVVVCGHHRGRTPTSDVYASRRASQDELVARCMRLRSDERIGSLFAKHRVVVRALWFDVDEGDIFVCSVEGERVLIGDQDFAAMLGLS